MCQNSSSNFVKNEVEALEYILSDLSFDHLVSVDFPDENTISITGGRLLKPDGSIYKYTYTFPIKVRLLDGDYYATEDALRNSIASFLAKKSAEGVYVTEYELEGSQYLYNVACAPLYAKMLCDTGAEITLEQFINAMGPQWEIQCANINSEISIRELIHNLLDLAGMIPVVGWVFDGVNAGIYFVEGDVLNGCISMLGTIEFWGSCYALRIALKNGDSISKIAAKKLGECISRVKSGGDALEDIASATRIVDGYEFVTSDGIIFKMVDDDILYSSKNLIKSLADSTDEVITCLKTKPEALFELVKETEKLDDGIFFKFIDGTEIKIFNSDLTDEMHAALVGPNGLLVTGDCTEEMAKAFDDAVKNAKARGITDVGELIGTGKAAAEAIETILKAGVSLDDLARWGVKSDAGKAKLAAFIKQGLDPKGDMYFYEWFNRSTFGFDELENLGIKTYSDLNNRLIDFERISDDGLEHIFRGQVDGNSLGGYHYNNYPNANARVKSVTKDPNGLGVYEAIIETLDGSAQKMSTFFPDDWTTKQVLDAIIEAYWNRVPADGGWFRGTSKGMTIQMGIEYGPLGIPRIVTAYPIY